MLFELPENTRIEAVSKSGDWIFNQRKKDTRVIVSSNQEPGLHLTWGKDRTLSQEYQVSPHGLEDELRMSRIYHCINLISPCQNPIEKLLNFNRLRLAEHFFALRPLLQLNSLSLDFPDGAVPYSITALSQITNRLINERIPVSNTDSVFVTPKETFSVKSGISEITVKPTKEPGLHISAEFNYSNYKKLAWLGEGESEFHSDSSDPMEFVNTPAPIMHNILKYIFEKLHDVNFNENLIEKEEALNNPILLQAVFNHKILDLLGSLNIGHELLAADIRMKKGGHQSHMVMREKIREIGLKKII